MQFLALLLLSTSTLAYGFQVDSRSLSWHPPKSGKPPVYADGWETGSIKMPFVTGEPRDIAMRINDALYISEMKIPAPDKPGKSFALPAGMDPEGTSEMDFKVNRNDVRVLEIEFSGEGCGAYCETYTEVVDFDARSGRAISLDDVLTPSGKTVVAKRMRAERRAQYSAQIRDLKKERQSQLNASKKSGKKIDLEDIDARIALNENCLGADSLSDKMPPSLDYVRFSLPSRKGIVLTVGRCSAHVDQGIDDVGEVSLTLTPKDLPSLLTPYGKALLLDQGDAPTPTSVFGQVLHGKLGGAAITVMLDERVRDGSFRGHYFYAKYRKLIPLEGKIAGKQLTLTEEVNDKDQATFKLNLGESGVSGTWRGGGRELPVVISY